MPWIGKFLYMSYNIDLFLKSEQSGFLMFSTDAY